MYMFTKKYNTYDDYDKKKLTNETNSAYAFGRAGNEKNEPVAALRAKIAADIAAQERVVALFNYVKGDDGMHKYIRDHLVQDRKWLAHYDKCLENTKKGFEQLKLDAKSMVEEAFKAGEISAEKALTLRIEAEKAKQKVQQEQNKSKDFQHNKDRDNQNKDRDNQNKDRDNQRRDNKVLVVDRMVVREVVSDKKKDKKNKDKDKDKEPKFYTLKHN